MLRRITARKLGGIARALRHVGQRLERLLHARRRRAQHVAHRVDVGEHDAERLAQLVA